MHTHTHTRTHVHMYTRTHAHTRSRAHAHKRLNYFPICRAGILRIDVLMGFKTGITVKLHVAYVIHSTYTVHNYTTGLLRGSGHQKEQPDMTETIQL